MVEIPCEDEEDMLAISVYCGFPGVTCISVNGEAVHGVPGRRRLHQGDLVKLDVTAELDGF